MTKHLERGLTALALTALPLLATAPPVHAAAVPRYFQIGSQLNGKCLASDGDDVEVRTCGAGASDQLWYWSDKKLVNAAEEHCLDVRKGKADAAAQVFADCHGRANQRWYKEGSWLRTEATGQCLSIQNKGDEREHAGLDLRACGTHTWQWWSLPAS
ncbi:RICIN domain-containing protein [Streptomyces sp. NPDC048277]|uniref:RICIN domain-containing protein n=1 Tax=Streptomyces sp. NPDC048277 TaxID=3155027 RepID=UPI003411AD67